MIFLQKSIMILELICILSRSKLAVPRHNFRFILKSRSKSRIYAWLIRLVHFFQFWPRSRSHSRGGAEPFWESSPVIKLRPIVRSTECKVTFQRRGGGLNWLVHIVQSIDLGHTFQRRRRSLSENPVQLTAAAALWKKPSQFRVSGRS